MLEKSNDAYGLNWEKTEKGSFKRVHNKHFTPKQIEDAKESLEKDKEEKRIKMELEKQAQYEVEMQMYCATKRKQKLEEETKYLAKTLLKVYKDLNPFEIISKTNTLLAPEEDDEIKEYERIAGIYGEHARLQITDTEIHTITKKALSLVQNVARDTIEFKCGELVQKNPVKTLSLY